MVLPSSGELNEAVNVFLRNNKNGLICDFWCRKVNEELGRGALRSFDAPLWRRGLLQGMVDTNGYNLIMKGALQTKDFVENGQWDEATDEWGNLEGDIDSLTFGVDFYNILSKIQAGEEGSYRGRLRGPTARKPMGRWGSCSNHYQQSTSEIGSKSKSRIYLESR